jgi:hypothetical protein
VDSAPPAPRKPSTAEIGQPPLAQPGKSAASKEANGNDAQTVGDDQAVQTAK